MRVGAARLGVVNAFSKLSIKKMSYHMQTPKQVLPPLLILGVPIVLLFGMGYIEGQNKTIREQRVKIDSLQRAADSLERRSDFYEEETERLEDALRAEAHEMAKAMHGETKRPREQRFVAWTVRNRMERRYFPATPSRVVHAPAAYTPMRNPTGDPPREVVEIAIRVLLAPKDADPTNGATHFYSPISMRPRMSAPKWAAQKQEIRTPLPTHRFRFFKPS
jgi:hypothetical protein